MQAWVSFGNDSYAKGLSVPQVFVSCGQPLVSVHPMLIT